MEPETERDEEQRRSRTVRRRQERCGRNGEVRRFEMEVGINEEFNKLEVLWIIKDAAECVIEWIIATKWLSAEIKDYKKFKKLWRKLYLFLHDFLQSVIEWIIATKWLPTKIKDYKK